MLLEPFHHLPMHSSCLIIARLLIPAPVELVTRSVIPSDVFHLHQYPKSVVGIDNILMTWLCKGPVQEEDRLWSFADPSFNYCVLKE